MKTVFLIPVFNDWEVLALLLQELDKVLEASHLPALCLVVDDGSTLRPEKGDRGHGLVNISEVQVVRLRRNVGHQRAIAVGLAYVYDHIAAETLVIMDADGEDRPRDALRILERLAKNAGSAIVFAERQRRFEPLWFRIFYQAYRLVHRMLTGIPVKVGNFSGIPHRLLGSLVAVSELWSHYAAAVFRSRIPYESIPTTRGTRLAGESKMNFVSLVTHGLAAISVFGEIVGTRVVILALSLIGVLGLALAGLLASQMIGAGPTPVWAVAVILAVLFAMAQIFTIAAGSLLFILYARNQYHFLPIRDYKSYVYENGD